ncbi:MAG: Glutamine-dependent NAD(+) synthetase [bacterium ADurb.Bin478]|nr:MAG: Glutamine-dependent NAD(+) synthetase [bacterium ADurb.Bin478]
MDENRTLRLGLVQMNSTVGDLETNKKKIAGFIEQGRQQGCDLVAFPELALTGYPPEDLLLRKQFVEKQSRVLAEIAALVKDEVVVLGCVEEANGFLYNSAAVLFQGRQVASYHKVNLPNYSVFDEERYFKSGHLPLVLQLGQIRVGVSICEDIWIDDSVVEAEAFDGQAQVLLNLSASPYHVAKGAARLALLQNKARKTRSAVVYVNLVGGQDELVFDGQSLVIDENGRVLHAMRIFQEEMQVLDLNVAGVQADANDKTYLAKEFQSSFAEFALVQLPKKAIAAPGFSGNRSMNTLSRAEEVYQALLMGLSDYTTKNRFKKVCLGLSGGIDSALVAALAVDALGKENVVAVSMPSPFSSTGSVEDAKQLADNFAIRFIYYPIRALYEEYLDTLHETFSGLASDVTEENLQARIRGNLLMALSNKFGWLVLVTGNKSEVSVGYCTIYGDTAGGFAPLKDVYKTLVYDLCRYRNQAAGFDIIPTAILEKPPSAELRPNQKDQDSLPPYDLLDAILELYVEKEMGVPEIVERGYDLEVVRKVARLVDFSEYKRRQAAPGVKITPRAFGKDRRMPITNGFRI